MQNNKIEMDRNLKNIGKVAHLVTLSAAITPERLAIARDLITTLGNEVEYSDSILDSYLYYAGTPEIRAEKLNKAYSSNADYIFVVAGGMGAIHLLDKINYDLIRGSGKVFAGYSDVTLLLNAIYQKTGERCIHGPNFGKVFEKFDHYTFKYFFDALEKVDYSISFKDSDIMESGNVIAPIVGGNLRLLVRSLGTGFDIETDGKIVFLEAVDKTETWIFDMLWQMKLAGKFDNVKGIILGKFNDCGEMVDTYLKEFFKDFTCPIITNQNIGHNEPNISIPIGENCFIDTKQNKWGIKFL
ncbi:MAG: muramoyltetrapeptide carboxypeptidase [Patescibacteria group bacterium]|jgi:muramoyltetrapeptide carboxypeptidase